MANIVPEEYINNPLDCNSPLFRITFCMVSDFERLAAVHGARFSEQDVYVYAVSPRRTVINKSSSA